MWFEARGGGTANPMVWVHAGPSGAHPMGFHVPQDVWDYVAEHGLDLRYNRRFVQGQLDAIKAVLDSPPIQATLTATMPATAASRLALTPLAWALGATALATAGLALAVRVRRREAGDRARSTDA